MRKVRQRPARTLPVAVLDLLLDAVGAVRGLIRRVPRLLPVRRGDRVMATVIGVAALVALIGTGFLVIGLLRAPNQLAPLGVAPPPTPVAEPTPTVERDGASTSPTPPAVSPRPPSPTPPPARRTPEPRGPRPPAAPPTLGARYVTENVTLLNYTAAVTISNPGPGAVTGWTLTITLPRSTQAIGEVTGAEASRNGSTWTFVPVQTTRRVPANGSVRVRFRVDGALFDSGPTSCRIDNRDCVLEPADR